MRIIEVDSLTWAHAYRDARQSSDRIREATSSAYEILSMEALTFHLSDDEKSGYAIAHSTRTIVGLFSTIKGRGDALVESAIASGGRNLDCFDGYLPKLYARHGFIECDRLDNWTEGGADVVFMERQD